MKEKNKYYPPSSECLELEPTGLLVSGVVGSNSMLGHCLESHDETSSDTSMTVVGSGSSVCVKTKNDGSES